MKLLLLALLLIPVVFAHEAHENRQAGPYILLYTTEPTQLEPGRSDIIISVLENNVPVANTSVWVRLADEDNVYLAGTFITNDVGTVSLSYYFNGPGTYTLTTALKDYQTSVELHVHGQSMLLFGFLAAVFITLAILLEKVDSRGAG